MRGEQREGCAPAGSDAVPAAQAVVVVLASAAEERRHLIHHLALAGVPWPAMALVDQPLVLGLGPGREVPQGRDGVVLGSAALVEGAVHVVAELPWVLAQQKPLATAATVRSDNSPLAEAVAGLTWGARAAVVSRIICLCPASHASAVAAVRPHSCAWSTPVCQEASAPQPSMTPERVMLRHISLQ